MSVLPCQEAINSSDLQIWNNAAFDNGDSQDSSLPRSLWCPLNPMNPSDSASKENQSPLLLESLLPVKSPAPVKPLPAKQSKVIPQQILAEKKIDDEIEEIEKEISRLSSRLEVLRVEKADHDHDYDQNVKLVQRSLSGRIVPAKFMESKKVVKNTECVKKIEETSSNSAKLKMQRRGFTMGPLEIMAGMHSRGISLGPLEIGFGAKLKQLGKQEVTPGCTPSVRRNAYLMKVKEIDEEMGNGNKEMRRTLSLSPNSRKVVCKTRSLRQAATTVGSKKSMKKEDAVLVSMQPKKLFKDGDKSDKKPLKELGRVISSRYNQSTVQSGSKSAMRERSSIESDEDGIKNFGTKRASSVGKSRETCHVQGTETRVKKKWQIPSELVVANDKFEVEKSPISITDMDVKLPRIRILRCANDTGRDSGPAKRVAELVGKKSFFSDVEDEVPFVCQTLKFDEEVVQK